MAKLTVDQRDRLVESAYKALLDRVSRGALAETDPSALVAEQGAPWSSRTLAVYLASALVDYAADLAAQDVDARETARRQRVFAISQDLYDNLRMTTRLVGEVATPDHSGAATLA